MPSAEDRLALVPIDLARDFDRCIAFRRDSFVASFGTDTGFDEEVGTDNAHYLAWLRERIAQVPEGNVHLLQDGRIVGQAEVRLVHGEPDVGYVNLFYVVPECRGRGLGRVLHEHAVRVFRARGMRRLRLSVSLANVDALAFYRRLGWVAVGERPNRQTMAILEFALEDGRP